MGEDKINRSCGNCKNWMTQQCPIERNGGKPSCNSHHSINCTVYELSYLYKPKYTFLEWLQKIA